MMPPSPQGTVQEQLVRQYSYLFQMAQQLNVALGQLESGGTAAPSGGTAAPAAEREQARNLDRIFQRDSRRYDGGFFLY